MADGDNNQLVKLVVLGGAGFAAWKFLYQPWAIQQRLNAEIQAQTAANLKKGMSLSDASTAAVSGACQAVAAFYKIPPDKSGGVCHGIGALATYTTALTIKALGKGAKAIGKAGKVVGHDVAVVGKGIGRGAKATASAVKFVSYTAPKKAVIGVGKGLKFASYTAPKKVVTTVAKDVGKGAKAVAKSISHGFGLWGLDPHAAPPRSRRASAGFPARGTRRQGLPQLANQRKRRSLTGLPAGRPARSNGAAFYTRHLR